MKHRKWRSFALLSLALTFASTNLGGRPWYGGVLRLQTQARIVDLRPAAMAGDADHGHAGERISRLVLEPLVRVNLEGKPEPALAVAWTHSPDFRQWTFSLRDRVMFHDGTDLDAAGAAACLSEFGSGLNFTVADASTLIIRSDDPSPDLLQRLALPDFWVVKPGEGLPIGTGPFRVERWDPGNYGMLVAFERHWEGRPFLDVVDIRMGQSAREQRLDLEVGNADIVEVPVEELPRWSQRGFKVVTTPPADLLVLVFSQEGLRRTDPRSRESLAFALDRASIVRGLLHGQGESTGALLPQWMSGYAWLFPGVRDLPKAAEGLRRAEAPMLTLSYPARSSLGKTVAERISLDVEELIKIRVVPEAVGLRWDLRLVRLPVASPHVGQALAKLAARLSLDAPDDVSSSNPESLFRAERELTREYRVIPVCHVPDSFALSKRVQFWQAEDVFLPHASLLENVWVDERSERETGTTR